MSPAPAESANDSQTGLVRRVPGYLVARLPGFQATWLPGYLGVRLPGCQATWLPGYLGVRLPGCQATWVPGYLVTRLPGSGSQTGLVRRVPGYLGVVTRRLHLLLRLVSRHLGRLFHFLELLSKLREESGTSRRQSEKNKQYVRSHDGNYCAVNSRE